MPKFRELSLDNANWTSIAGNWSRRQTDIVHSPSNVAPNSFNLFVCDKEIRDGAIEAVVKPFAGGDNSGRLAFRYGPAGCYYAGVGGYGRHFAIVKHVRSADGIVSVGIGLDGFERDIRFEEPYLIRVEFVEENITLISNGVTVLKAQDDWFKDGHIGLETYGQTRVEFSQIRTYEVPPITQLLKVLESFPYTLRRDIQYLERTLQDEKDVQRVLWTVLRSHFTDLVDEEVLGKFGLKHYQDDFGIPSLATIVEVKVIRDKTALKKLQEELMVDAVGYLATMTGYRHLVFFIYNMANRTVDSAFVEALESLDPVAAVVIVPGVAQ